MNIKKGYILAKQLRAARVLVGWEQRHLAEAAGLAIGTIRRMEASDGAVRGTADNVWKVQHTLENSGVVFINENGGGPGVRLKKRRGD